MSQQMATKKHSIKTKGLTQIFDVPEAWEPIRHLGSGAYGTVCAFDIGSTRVAVKKVDNVMSDCIKAIRTLREIRLLAHLQHPNVLGIKQVFANSPSFKDVYVCLELMDSDLHNLIHKRASSLQETHCESIMFQLACGLLCLHTASIVHRDLKPGNVLVSGNGSVKLADFGLARAIGARVQEEGLTEYVVTRYYRAPEIVLTATEYTYAVDVWSAGCILGEMFLKRPLFQGTDALDQIRKIVRMSGGLSNVDLRWLPRESSAMTFIINNATKDKHRCEADLWQQLEDAPLATEAARNLLSSMLSFNPSSRISARDVLQHAYLEAFDGLEHPDAVSALQAVPVDWSFDSDLLFDNAGDPIPMDEELCRKMIWGSQTLVPEQLRNRNDRPTLLQNDVPRSKSSSLGSGSPIAAIKRKIQL